jgi:uncharacterized protein (DUF1330 family)
MPRRRGELGRGPQKERLMVAYVVFTREKMRNPEEYERYREKARPAAAGHPLKPLALYGKYEVLEGPAIEGAVVLEFPTLDAAKAYYNSSAYQDALQHRLLAADYRVFIVEGL